MGTIAGWVDYNKNLYEEDRVMRGISDTFFGAADISINQFKCSEAYMISKAHIAGNSHGMSKTLVGDIDGTKYTIVFVGALYNANELKKELAKGGEKINARSNAEILLLSYIEWGESCLDKLNGKYAFAIWNDKDKELFIARDRIGAKPLFFYRYDGGIIFASEIKNLLAHPYIKPEIDRLGIASIMLLGPGRAPGDGVFKGVKELKPAHFIRVSKDGISEHEYWRIRAQEHNNNMALTTEKVNYLITDSIERQVKTDSPLCTFLSGGLDSSIISGVVAKKYNEKGKKLTTYSVDYVDNDINFKSTAFQPNSDTPYAQSMADSIGSNHKSILLDTPKLINALDSAVYARGLPGMADVDSSLLLFCKEVKKDYDVAISGECADEIFGGYPWFHKKDILFKDGFPWSVSTDLRKRLVCRGIFKDLDANEYVDTYYQKTVGKTSYLESDSPLEKRMRTMFLLNIKWFMQTLMDRNDRMSSANGVDIRTPFSDHRIIEYAYNIPWSMKSYNDREKGLLRYAFKDLLPSDILWRRKSPYPKTHNPNYLESVKTIMNGIIEDKNSRVLEFIDKGRIRELIDTNAQSFNKPWYGQLMTGPQVLAYIIQVESWMRRFDIELKL